MSSPCNSVSIEGSSPPHHATSSPITLPSEIGSPQNLTELSPNKLSTDVSSPPHSTETSLDGFSTGSVSAQHPVTSSPITLPSEINYRQLSAESSLFELSTNTNYRFQSAASAPIKVPTDASSHLSSTKSTLDSIPIETISFPQCPKNSPSTILNKTKSRPQSTKRARSEEEDTINEEPPSKTLRRPAKLQRKTSNEEIREIKVDNAWVARSKDNSLFWPTNGTNLRPQKGLKNQPTATSPIPHVSSSSTIAIKYMSTPSNSLEVSPIQGVNTLPLPSSSVQEGRPKSTARLGVLPSKNSNHQAIKLPSFKKNPKHETHIHTVFCVHRLSDQGEDTTTSEADSMQKVPRANATQDTKDGADSKHRENGSEIPGNQDRSKGAYASHIPDDSLFILDTPSVSEKSLRTNKWRIIPGEIYECSYCWKFYKQPYEHVRRRHIGLDNPFMGPESADVTEETKLRDRIPIPVEKQKCMYCSVYSLVLYQHVYRRHPDKKNPYKSFSGPKPWNIIPTRTEDATQKRTSNGA